MKENEFEILKLFRNMSEREQLKVIGFAEEVISRNLLKRQLDKTNCIINTNKGGVQVMHLTFFILIHIKSILKNDLLARKFINNIDLFYT